MVPHFAVRQVEIDCKLSSRVAQQALAESHKLQLSEPRRFLASEPDCLRGLAGCATLRELSMQASEGYLTGADSCVLVLSISHLTSLHSLHLSGMELPVRPLSAALAALTGGSLSTSVM